VYPVRKLLFDGERKNHSFKIDFEFFYALMSVESDAVRDQSSREQIKDKFRIERLDDKIITHYRSPNRHCHLYVALAQEVLSLYNEQAAIEEFKCLKRAILSARSGLPGTNSRDYLSAAARTVRSPNTVAVSLPPVA
jgi:hypothetical protein